MSEEITSKPKDARIDVESEPRRNPSPRPPDVGHQDTHGTPQGPKDDPAEKLWECGDPYQYPFPKPEGDCWSLVFNEKLKRDTIKCEAWKDEVQNLLIFAGLFSAVVTAFLIESYKTLQPDANDTIIFLLNRIANDTHTLSPPTFTRSASTIRINVVWFLSLILSLATVLVGIISLQWLREHQRYTPEISQRTSVSVFQLRAQGLDEWYVPQIFAGLPVLLQLALVLFFFGVVDFLFTLDFIVAIPVTVGIAFILLFIVTTTMLPTLQLFIPRNREETKIPGQCPYKSPQAWLFFRFSSLVYCAFARIRLIPAWIGPYIGGPLVPFGLVHYDYRKWNIDSWIPFDSWWLRIPEAIKRTSPAPSNWSDVLFKDQTKYPEQTYIEAESLIEAIEMHSTNYTVACALYYCIHEVSNSRGSNYFNSYYVQKKPTVASPYLSLQNRRSFVNQYAPSRMARVLSGFSYYDWSTGARPSQDENKIWFIGALLDSGCPELLKTRLTSHLLELNSRSTAYILTRNRFHDYRSEENDESPNGHEYLDFPGSFTLDEMMIPTTDIEASVRSQMVSQCYLIFDSLIQECAEVKDEGSLKGTTYSLLSMLVKFCIIPPKHFRHKIMAPHEELPQTLQQTLYFISSTLCQSITDESPCPPLFHLASVFTCELFKTFEYEEPVDAGSYGTFMVFAGLNNWNYHPVHSKPILSLLDALFKYFDHFKPTAMEDGLNRTIYIWSVSPTFELTRFEVPSRPEPPLEESTKDEEHHTEPATESAGGNNIVIWRSILEYLSKVMCFRSTR